MPRFQKVYLEITNRCNLACSFCPGTRRPARIMSPAEFDLLAGKLRPFTDFLYLHVMGEPLLHPALCEILDGAHAHGFKVAITTNGTLFERCAPMLYAHACAPLYKLSLSLHAYEANGRFLPGEAFDRTMELCRGLGDKGVITVLRLWNLEGRADGARNADNGAILEALHRAFPGEWTPNRGGPRIGHGVYLEWGEKFDWPNLSAPDFGDACRCFGLRDQLGVLCDGTVVPCCMDGEGVIALGNLFSSSVEEILASPRAVAIEEGFSRARAVEPLCRRCGFARRDK